jgi:hypothetical protein
MADQAKDATGISHVLHVDAVKAETGEEQAIILLRLESDTLLRIPIRAEAAARLASLLAKVCEEQGWSPPNEPVSSTRIQ